MSALGQKQTFKLLFDVIDWVPNCGWPKGERWVDLEVGVMTVTQVDGCSADIVPFPAARRSASSAKWCR